MFALAARAFERSEKKVARDLSISSVEEADTDIKLASEQFFEFGQTINANSINSSQNGNLYKSDSLEYISIMDKEFAVPRDDIFKLNKLTYRELDEFLAEERSKLKSIGCSSRYKSCTKLLRAFMRFFSYELIHYTKGSPDTGGGVKNVIGIKFLSKESGESTTIYLIDRIVKPLCIAISVYCTFKWFTFAILKLERDHLAADLHSTEATPADHKILNGCTTRDKLAEPGPNMERLNRLDHWLELLADPLISVPGMACLVFFLFAVLICYCFSIANFIRRTRSRVEFLSFIFDFLGERESTRNEIASMIDSLVAMIDWWVGSRFVF